jgi:uncharacterized protein (TIRG00374 family)
MINVAGWARHHPRTAGSRQHRPVRSWVRAAVPAVLALTAIGGLLLTIDARSVAGATARLDLAVVVLLLLLSVAFYALQGLRWHLLLRYIGVRQRVAESELINLAGQAVTAVLPLGDLTRALMVSEASGTSFGAAAATVTVQELTFTLLLVLAAIPGLSLLPGGIAWMALVVAGVAAIVVILTVPRVFDAVRRVVARTPGVRRLLTQIDALQVEVRHLLAGPAVLAGASLDLARVVVATTSLWLVLHGLGIDTVTWWGAALVFAVAYVGGAISFLPGGIGANEASVVGLLVLLGVSPVDAAATALVQRLAMSGVATLGGLGAYLAVRRRLHLSGLTALRPARATATAS